MTKGIQELTTQIAELTKQKDKLFKTLRKRCKHKDVIEGSYVSLSYSGAIPPRRMCLNCKIEEEGWGCGYQILRDMDGRTVREVTREDFYKVR